MEKVNKKSLLVLVAAIMLLSVFAVSYAFFRYAMDSNTSAQNRAITARVTLDYTDCATGVDDCKEINASLKPGDSVTKTFKVENTGNVAAAYSIYFAELQNSFLHDELTYKLEDITNVTPVTVIDTTPVPYKASKDVNIDMLTYAGLGVNETKEYRLTITFTNADRDQGDNASATFDIKLGIKEEIYHAPVPVVKNIYCVNDSNEEIDCPSTFTMGDRIAIGRDTPQYFRYIRTTSTSTQLAECGTTESVACADSTDGDLRFLAEYNLKRTGDATSSTAIASNALQDSSDSSNTNSVRFGASADYNQSYVKTYLNNYATVLNTMIGKANAVTVNALSRAEAESLFGCPGNGTCSSIPTWAKNSNYWLGSANNSSFVWCVYDGNLNYDYYFDDNNLGARPVIMIDASELQ